MAAWRWQSAWAAWHGGGDGDKWLVDILMRRQYRQYLPWGQFGDDHKLYTKLGRDECHYEPCSFE
jgi:hypothetical protein